MSRDGKKIRNRRYMGIKSAMDTTNNLMDIRR
jgi:hypothetical protein